MPIIRLTIHSVSIQFHWGKYFTIFFFHNVLNCDEIRIGSYYAIEVLLMDGKWFFFLKKINNWIFFYRYANNTHVRDWRLIYSPKNAVLEALLIGASRSLGLSEPIGVNSSKQVQKLVSEFGYFAGILFDHDAVIDWFSFSIRPISKKKILQFLSIFKL